MKACHCADPYRRGVVLLAVAGALLLMLTPPARAAGAAGGAGLFDPGGGDDPLEVDAPEQDAAEALEVRPEDTAPPLTTVLSDEGGIEIHAKNEDLVKVLELISRLQEINIVASKQVTGKVTADLYNVTLAEALDALARANNLRWVREGDFIYVHTPEELKQLRMDEDRLVTEVYHLNYLTAEDAIKLIQPALSELAVVAETSPAESGIASGGEEVGGNSYGLADAVVVRDFPENHEKVAAILEKMDRRPRQVLIEATILQVELTDNTSLGINFNTLAGVNFRDLQALAPPAPASPSTDPTTVMGDISETARASLQPWGTTYTRGFATPGDGLNIGIMTNNVSVFIQAVEEVTDANVISNPKVLALNKQRAEVIVGDRLGYRTTQVTETTAIETVEFLDTGTQLIFRPYISDDGYIRMEVHPEVSSAVLTGPADNPLPQETTAEVTCNVMVRDGETIVIGGLFDENVTSTKTGVPFLHNLPLVGPLFRSHGEDTERREYIVLLTPHIIQEDQAYAMGRQLKDDISRRGFGLREGFSVFTRERMTVGYLQEAEAAWERYQETGKRGDLDGAWWNANLALNVAPNNMAALRLKDRLIIERTGKAELPRHWTLWDSIQLHMNSVGLLGHTHPAVEWRTGGCDVVIGRPRPCDEDSLPRHGMPGEPLPEHGLAPAFEKPATIETEPQPPAAPDAEATGEAVGEPFDGGADAPGRYIGEIEAEEVTDVVD